MEEESESEQTNTFSNLGRRGLARKPSAVSSADELTHYLAAPCEDLADEDVLDWWELKKAKYPHLYHMATSYLTAPGASSLISECSHTYFTFLSLDASVYVERTFSRGRLVLSHIRNRLSAERTRAVLCLGEWSRFGWVLDNDIHIAASEPEEDGSLEDYGDLLKGAVSSR